MSREKMQEKLGKTTEGRALLSAINAFDSCKEMADTIGVSRQTIDNWAYIAGRCSKNGAILIAENVEGVTREELRPDVKDWSAVTDAEPRNLLEDLRKTGRGRGLYKVLKRVKFSRKALASLLGIRSAHMVQNWIVRGYLPKQHVMKVVGLPDFEGLTAEIIRPDLHAADYL